MYFVNWQRDITISTFNGEKVVIKKNKVTKEINEYLLVFIYSFISIIMLHPSSPLRLGKNMVFNEGKENRKNLAEKGIETPKLYHVDDKTIIEEYIDGGNLYNFLKNNGDINRVFDAGIITARLHNNGLCFIDNKSQNYLIKDKQKIIRTDLGLIKRDNSDFGRSLDIGTFLASIIDLKRENYEKAEQLFINGYRKESGKKIPNLSVIIRNTASLVFTSNHQNLVNNLLNKNKIH